MGIIDRRSRRAIVLVPALLLLVSLLFPAAVAAAPVSPSGQGTSATPGPVLPKEGGAIEDPIGAPTPWPSPSGSTGSGAASERSLPLQTSPASLGPPGPREESAPNAPAVPADVDPPAATASLVGWVGVLLLALLVTLSAGVAVTTPAVLRRSARPAGPPQLRAPVPAARPTPGADPVPAPGPEAPAEPEPEAPAEPEPEAAAGPVPETVPRSGGMLATVRRAWTRRGIGGTGLVLLVPLLVGTAVLAWTGLHDAPRQMSDEGRFAARVWAAVHGGSAAPAGAWYEYPPAGWLQVAGYSAVTGGGDSVSGAVGSGRELMALLAVVSAALLWVLARRIGFPRWAAGVAVAVFGAAPLAIQSHRILDPANLAVPWVLAAFVLVLTPARRRVVLVGAAASFAVAVLSAPTALVLLPLLAALAWPPARERSQRRGIDLAPVGILTGLAYALVALLAGVRDQESLTGIGLAQWIDADPVLPVVVVLAAVVALALRSLRAVGLVVLLLAAMQLAAPIAQPASLIIVLLPFGALLTAGAARGIWRYRPTRMGRRDVRRSGGAVVAGAAVVAVVAVAPGTLGRITDLTRTPAERPLSQATDWVERNVALDERILTDDAVWVDLVEQGRDRSSVVPVSAVGRAGGYQWVLATSALSADAAVVPGLMLVVLRSEVAASFGSGDTRVDVLRVATAAADIDDDSSGASGPVAPLPDADLPPELPADPAAAAAAGRQLVSNRSITVGAQAREPLVSGRVDPRLLVLLATAAARHEVTLTGFPDDRGGTGVVRSIAISAVDGGPATRANDAAIALAQEAAALNDPYRPISAFIEAGGGTPPLLVLTFPGGNP